MSELAKTVKECSVIASESEAIRLKSICFATKRKGREPVLMLGPDSRDGFAQIASRNGWRYAFEL